MERSRPVGVRAAFLAAGLAALAAVAAAGAAPKEIPNFAYTYALTTARYSLTHTASGDNYSGEGKMEGIRFPGNQPGPRRLGVLVHNNLFRSGTVQGTWQAAFRLTETWREVGASGHHCRGKEVLDSPWPVTIQLSILPSSAQVVARHSLFVPLGGHGCGSLLAPGFFRQTFPLSLFTRSRFTLTLRGSTRMSGSAAVHSLRWTVTLGVVRTGGYTLP